MSNPYQTVASVYIFRDIRGRRARRKPRVSRGRVCAHVREKRGRNVQYGIACPLRSLVIFRRIACSQEMICKITVATSWARADTARANVDEHMRTYLLIRCRMRVKRRFGLRTTLQIVSFNACARFSLRGLSPRIDSYNLIGLTSVAARCANAAASLTRNRCSL